MLVVYYNIFKKGFVFGWLVGLDPHSFGISFYFVYHIMYRPLLSWGTILEDIILGLHEKIINQTMFKK